MTLSIKNGGYALHFAITPSAITYNTPCNRFYNNYVIDICPIQFMTYINITKFILIN